jgi:DNA-binding NarL/FixJ family response regulator
MGKTRHSVCTIHTFSVSDSGTENGATVNSVGLVVVEDESLYREMLVTVLSQRPAIKVLGNYANTDEALARIPGLMPDAAILDIELPGSLDGIALGRALRLQLPRLGIILLSNHTLPNLLSTLPPEVVGGWSYLLKKSVSDIDNLTRAIYGATDGMVTLDSALVEGMRAREGASLLRLTNRQREILELIAQGYTNAAIAERLVIQEKSLEKYITTLYQELGIDRQDSALQPRVLAVLHYLRETRIRWSAARPSEGSSPAR